MVRLRIDFSALRIFFDDATNGFVRSALP